MIGKRSFGKITSGVGLLIIAVVCLNIIASQWHGRLDVTAESVYTLSDGSVKIIEGLSKPVDAKLYFSRSNKELPVQIKTYANRVEELLREYSNRSSGKLNLQVIDPKPDTDDEEWARKYGIQGMRLPSGNDLFFGVVLLQGTQEIAIPYIDPRREEFLEYDISEALLRTQKEKKSKIGIISSLPVIAPSNPYGYGQPGEEDWAFVSELKKNFEVTEIKPGAGTISQDLGVLIIYHPKNLSDEALYAIDQYVLSGGRVIACVDPMSRTEQMMQQNPNPMANQQADFSSNLNKLFTSWGIVFHTDEMVGDHEHSVRINAGGQTMNYPFFMALQDDSLSKDSVITSNLNSFLYAEGGYLDVVKDSGIKMEPLISASKMSSGVIKPMFGGFKNPIMLISNLKEDNKDKALAGLFTGKFKSAFPSGNPKGQGADNSNSLKESSENSAILVIADSDFIFDNNAVDKVRFLNQTIVRPRNGNLAFFINAVDFLGGSNELISIRSKGRISRPFTVVQEIQNQAQARWKKVEEDLSKQLSDLQTKLAELQKQRAQASVLSLSPEQQQEVEKFREEERVIRKKRREVRKNLREDIESLGTKLAAMNMLIMPLALSIFGFFSFTGRSRKMKGRKRGE